MAWTVDESAPRRAYNANKHTSVPAAGMAKYHEWRRTIVQQNLHPKAAAEQVGDMHYEQLKGKNKGTYTIRLSQEHRVVFTFNDTTEVVTVSQIGGHFP